MQEQALTENSVERVASVSSNLPRVCRIVWDYPVGGKPTYGLQPNFYYLSREQARRGYEMHVIARRHGSQPAFEVFDGVTVHRVGDPFSPNAIRVLRSLTRGDTSSVIHTHATSGLFMAALRRYFRAPLISHVHGTSRSAFMPATLKFGDLKLGYSPWTVTTSYLRERTLWSSADRVAAVSGAVEGDLVSYYGLARERIRVVYNGVDANLFRPIPEAEFPGLPELRGKRVVLYVGHFGLRKGLIHLIRAMSTVSKEVPDSALVCVGGVPDWLGKGQYWKYLRQLIANGGLEGKVFLVDKVSNKTLPVFYSACSVFVLPSYYEAFAKVVLEAMACGKPVVVSREGGPSEAIQSKSSSAGLLVDYGSETQLAEALITLLKDDRMAREMGNNGRRRIAADFTWEKVAQRIDLMYQEVLNGR